MDYLNYVKTNFSPAQIDFSYKFGNYPNISEFLLLLYRKNARRYHLLRKNQLLVQFPLFIPNEIRTDEKLIIGSKYIHFSEYIETAIKLWGETNIRTANILLRTLFLQLNLFGKSKMEKSEKIIKAILKKGEEITEYSLRSSGYGPVQVASAGGIEYLRQCKNA